MGKIFLLELFLLLCWEASVVKFVGMCLMGEPSTEFHKDMSFFWRPGEAVNGLVLRYGRR